MCLHCFYGQNTGERRLRKSGKARTEAVTSEISVKNEFPRHFPTFHGCEEFCAKNFSPELRGEQKTTGTT